MKRLLRKLFLGEPPIEASTITHAPVPVQLEGKPTDWREQKLHEAAARYGRPFKCASYAMDREFIAAPGVVGTAKACRSAVKPKPPKNVSRLERVA